MMNVFSFMQWNKYFHLVKDEMYHSTPHENICTIALKNIHYLYTNHQLNRNFNAR